MGRIYRDLARYQEAEKLTRRAIELAQRVQEQDNPNVAIFQRSLANLYLVSGREAEAETLYRESLATLEKTLGAEHYETQATRTMLERSFPEAEDPP
jgi:tetratricopeptide (TPR) repeat protein